MRDSPAILESFGKSSLAYRRQRGPVAFRLRLSAGLALSLSSCKRMGTNSHQLRLPCPAKKPAFFIEIYVALGDGAEIKRLSKNIDSVTILRVHNVVQAITRFLARSLDN